ncbi:MAG: type II toxin-antitoxin system PemK/MazF family toxin [Spirochaetales bacterium]|nr:type II toxin-antitoxin system PemK/MazF family toxin [Spirochaetales bacterium]
MSKKESGLSKDSVALVHQIIVVDKIRLENKLSKLPKDILKKIENEIDYVTKE